MSLSAHVVWCICTVNNRFRFFFSLKKRNCRVSYSENRNRLTCNIPSCLTSQHSFWSPFSRFMDGFGEVSALLWLFLFRCSFMSDVPCSSLRYKGNSQNVPCTIACVCHCNINCNNEKTVHQWIKVWLFHSLVVFECLIYTYYMS